MPAPAVPSRLSRLPIQPCRGPSYQHEKANRHALPAAQLRLRACSRPCTISEHVVNASAQAASPRRPGAHGQSPPPPERIPRRYGWHVRWRSKSAGTLLRFVIVKRIYGVNFLPCGGCATVLAPLLGYHVTSVPIAFCWWLGRGRCCGRRGNWGNTMPTLFTLLAGGGLFSHFRG